MFCMKCGASLPDDAVFCYKCGNKIQIIVQSTKKKDEKKDEIKDEIKDEKKKVRPQRKKSERLLRLENGKGVDFVIDNYTMHFSENIVEYNKYRKSVHDYSKYAVDKASIFWDENIEQIEDVLEKGEDKAWALINGALKNGIKMLMKAGIDDVDVDQLMECSGNSVNPDGFMSFFYNIAESIDDKETELSVRRDISRNSRSHWQGGGFGIKGAVKGAVTAGVLNAGTGLIRGIGDILVDSSDKRRIEKMRTEAVRGNEAKYLFVTGIGECCDSVMDGLYKILLKRERLLKLDFNTKKEYAKVQNYLSYGKYDEIITAFCANLRKNPYCVDSYAKWIDFEPMHYKALFSVSKYFGLEQEVSVFIFDKINEKHEKYGRMQESSISDIHLKIKELDILETEYNFKEFDYDLERKRLEDLFDSLLLKQSKSEAIEISEGVDEQIARLEKIKSDYKPLDDTYICEHIDALIWSFVEELKEDTIEQIEIKSKTYKFLKDRDYSFDEKTLSILCEKKTVKEIENLAEATIEDIEIKIDQYEKLNIKYLNSDVKNKIKCLKNKAIDILREMPEGNLEQIDKKIIMYDVIKKRNPDMFILDLSKLTDKRRVAEIEVLPNSTIREIEEKISKLRQLKKEYPTVDVLSSINHLNEIAKDFLSSLPEGNKNEIEKKIDAYNSFHENCSDVDVQEALERLEEIKLYINDIISIDNTMPETSFSEIEAKIDRLKQIKEHHKYVEIDHIVSRLESTEIDVVNQMPEDTTQEIDKKLKALLIIDARLHTVGRQRITNLRTKKELVELDNKYGIVSDRISIDTALIHGNIGLIWEKANENDGYALYVCENNMTQLVYYNYGIELKNSLLTGKPKVPTIMQKQANNGHLLVQYLIAINVWLDIWSGTYADKDKFKHDLIRLAKIGIPGAMFLCGIMGIQGNDQDINVMEARQFIEGAAQKNYPKAMEFLALVSYSGGFENHGWKKSNDIAKFFFERAVELGVRNSSLEKDLYGEKGYIIQAKTTNKKREAIQTKNQNEIRKVCVNCGKSVKLSVKYCNFCGLTSDIKKKRCNNCEAINDYNDKYCRSCGKAFMSKE